jgi:hypothetical protein
MKKEKEEFPEAASHPFEKPKTTRWAVQVFVKTIAPFNGVQKKLLPGIYEDPPQDLLDAADGSIIKKFKLN